MSSFGALTGPSFVVTGIKVSTVIKHFVEILEIP
jgi:hypothetical protein